MPNETLVNKQGATKILLVEDSSRMQESLVVGLGKLGGNYEFVAIVKNGEEALQVLQTKNEIGMVIMDYNLKDKGLWGVELTKIIKKQFPTLKILFWSIYLTHVDQVKAKNAGADGYIPKDSTDREVKDSIDKIMQGKMIWPCLEENPDPNVQLTETEILIMKYLARGKTNLQIAIELLRKEFIDLRDKYLDSFANQYTNFEGFIDEEHEVSIKGETKRITRLKSRERTVEKHLANIRKKLSAKTRGELIRIANEVYRDLEDIRGISEEEMTVLEFLHEGKTVEQIAQLLAANRYEIENIIRKFDPD